MIPSFDTHGKPNKVAEERLSKLTAFLLLQGYTYAPEKNIYFDTGFDGRSITGECIRHMWVGETGRFLIGADISRTLRYQTLNSLYNSTYVTNFLLNEDDVFLEDVIEFLKTIKR